MWLVLVAWVVVLGVAHVVRVLWRLKFPSRFVDLATQEEQREVRPLLDVLVHAALFHYGVLGDGWLFQSVLARINAGFTQWDVPFRAQGKDSRTEVLDFCRKWGVALEPWPWSKQPHEFQTKNEFFMRRFRPGSEPRVGAAPIVTPATAVCTFFESAERLPIEVKNERFVLDAETGVPDHEQFLPHPLTIHYLAPADYHRYHSPIAGTIRHMTLVNQARYSVTVKPYIYGVQNILKRNRRAIIVIEADGDGRMDDPLRVALVIIGGVTVDSIRLEALAVGRRVKKNQMLGAFARGGSSVACFFNRPVSLAPDCRAVHDRGLGFKLQVGQSLAVC